MHFNFTNSFINKFPLKTQSEVRSESTPNFMGTWATPIKMPEPKLLSYSKSALKLLDWDEDTFLKLPAEQIFSGNQQLSGMKAYATRYGGHQFGHWAGQLGDGRAMGLGEITNSLKQKWEIQLKGSGPTAYSRNGDGRAVLRSSIREFIASEAMFSLGVPSSRALCLVGTGEQVIRDMFYDGNPKYEPGAIVTRLAPSFLRFGHYQILSATGELSLLRELLDYTISTHFLQIHSTLSFEEKVLGLFSQILESTAMMIIHWMRVGFVHGVMNTDNMSIHGLTIDYGPYGFLDNFDPTWTPNTTDGSRRRYAFQNQPGIAAWNLQRLAESLSTVANSSDLEKELFRFQEFFLEQYWQMRFKKLGLPLGNQTQMQLIEQLDEQLYHLELDHTLFYAEIPTLLNSKDITSELKNISYLFNAQGEAFQPLKNILEKLYQENKYSEELAKNMNPYVVPRNYLTLNIIEETEQGNLESLNNYLKVMIDPYNPVHQNSEFAKMRPKAALALPGASQLSCSS